MKLQKRVSSLEKKASPERIKPAIELVGSRDQVENPHLYDRVLRSSGAIDVYELTPKPGYTPLPNN